MSMKSAHFLGFWKESIRAGIQPERSHQEKKHQEVSLPPEQKGLGRPVLQQKMDKRKQQIWF